MKRVAFVLISFASACGGVLLEDDGGTTDASPKKDGGPDVIVADVIPPKDVIVIDSFDCNPPLTMCGSVCVDTLSDPNHCGGCTNICGAVDGGTATCVNGACGITCSGGKQLCNGVCTDTQTDPNNCGGCNAPCPPQTTCTGGVCGGTTTGSTYSESFVNLQVAKTQCTDWEAWRAGLTGTYTSITLSGSNDTTGRTCTGTDANTLCQALHNGTTVNVTCGGFTWNVDFCSGMTWELTADNAACTCTDPGYNIRPCINTNGDWGGITTKSCSAPSQTLSVTCQ
jgi:hypothetical protein